MSGKVTELNDAIEDVRMRIREAARELENTEGVQELEHAIDEAAAELSELQDTLKRAVRKNPLLAVGIAAAIGYFLGTVGGRR